MKRLLAALRWAALGSIAGLFWNSTPTFAAGYLVPEMDAEAFGQAGAWTARARGSSAIFFNPAGLIQLKGFELSAGSTLISLTGEAKDLKVGVAGRPINIKVETNNGVAPPSHAYFGYKINDKLAAGIGMHTSFGLKVKWPQKWPDGQNFGSFVIEEVDLKTYNINPTIAYAINDKLSVGVGLQWVKSSAVLENQSDLAPLAAKVGVPGLPPLQLRLDASGSGDIGFDVGLLYRTEKFGAGISYRSQVNLKLEGDADFTTPVTGVPTLDGALASFFPDQTGSTEVPLPDLLAVGVSYSPNAKTELEVDVNFANWKDFDEFTIDFSKNTFSNPSDPNTIVLADRTRVQDWKNGFTFRVGGSYDINDMLEFRLGALYDPTVIPDEHLSPLLPEGNRLAGSTGLGVKMGSLNLDLFYMFFTMSEHKSAAVFDAKHPESPFNATYSGHANLFGVTLSFGS